MEPSDLFINDCSLGLAFEIQMPQTFKGNVDYVNMKRRRRWSVSLSKSLKLDKELGLDKRLSRPVPMVESIFGIDLYRFHSLLRDRRCVCSRN